jgi:hypothetical protein
VGITVGLDAQPHIAPLDHNAAMARHHATAKSQIGQSLVITGKNALQGGALGFCKAHKFLSFLLSGGRAIAWPENILVQQINLSTP